jgi:hypothetical protein
MVVIVVLLVSGAPARAFHKKLLVQVLTCQEWEEPRAALNEIKQRGVVRGSIQTVVEIRGAIDAANIERLPQAVSAA